LAAAYFAAIPLPDKAQADAYHLSLAAWYGLDYLVSWNCTHIVSGRVRMIIEEVNAEFGIRTPIICTPEEASITASATFGHSASPDNVTYWHIMALQ
jgi:hypothetical protein